MKYPVLFGCLTAALSITAAAADNHGNGNNNQIKTVFVIALENNNWVQADGAVSGGGQLQIFKNPNAPTINNWVNGTDAPVVINGRQVKISQQLAYATNYHNALTSANPNDAATLSGLNPHIHPSEPNYFWAEAATNFNIFNDDDPFAIDTSEADILNSRDNELHLSMLLTAAGRTWRTYQEDIDLTPASGQPTNTQGSALSNVPLPRSQWTVPLTSFSGNFASGFNQFNNSNQFNYAAKHNPMVLFNDTNGGNDATTANPLRLKYAPLQQLFLDLKSGDIADYNWITPNQHNDMHTALTGGFMGLTNQDEARIKQGDEFLRQIIPVIMASRAYQDHGAIIIWTDETEPDTADANPDDLKHTLTEIVISPDAHPNVNGVPYASPVFYTHSSDVLTMQEIFHVTNPMILRDAINANDLSDLFAKGAIPHDDDDGHGHGHGDNNNNH